MPDDYKKKLSPTAQDAYQSKVRVPHKFCPYCGTRNSPDSGTCENCGKDISWIKVPDPSPYPVAPRTHRPPELPERVFSRRALIIMLIILVIIAAAVLTLILVVPGKSATAIPAALAMTAVMAQAGLVASPMRSTPNRQPLRALYQSHISSPTRLTSNW